MALTVSDIEISSLTALDPADVEQILEQTISRVQTAHPTVDLKRGVFRDVLVYIQSQIETAIRTNLERYQSARSLQKVQEDPSLADDTVVDEILSNWNVTRQSGTKATGSVTIELSLNRSVVVPINFAFEANGNRYLTTDTFTARTLADQVVVPTDRILTQLDNGNYAFVVDVEAEEIGSSYKLNSGDLLVPDKSLANYVTSYATTAFSDGTNTETNEQLLETLQFGIASKSLSNRTTMMSWLRNQADFASATNQSIVGYGDPEMLRDQHTVFPISFGGRLDWYVRGQQSLLRTAYAFTAICISKSGANTSRWQFTLDKSVFPGFFEVTKIRPKNSSSLNSGFEIISDTRQADLEDEGWQPDIINTAEAAYTAFQTVTIVFEDTVMDVTGVAVGDTAEYICEITGMPLVREIQDVVSSRDIRHYGADVVIKAPVPCFVEISLTINKKAGDATPDVDAIKNAIVDVVNQVDFIGRLDGSRIVEKVHGFINNAMSVTDLDLFGRVRYPDGTVQYLRDPDSLVIPDKPGQMVTAKTVQFFAEITGVSVTVESSIPTAK